MVQTQLKDYVVFRAKLDEREGHRELAGESDLESEAIRFAELLAQAALEPESLSGIRYEVRLTATGDLIYRTKQVLPLKKEDATCKA